MLETASICVMIDPMSEFTDFLNAALNDHGWSISFFARRAGVSQSNASDVINGKIRPSANFAIATAEALGERPERLLRMADILPDEAPSVQEEEEALGILRSLPPDQRSSALLMLRGLAEGPPGSVRPVDPEPALALEDVQTMSPAELRNVFRQVASTATHMQLLYYREILDRLLLRRREEEGGLFELEPETDETPENVPNWSSGRC